MSKTGSEVESRSENIQAVLRYILNHDGATKQELFVHLGLSLPTIKQCLSRLLSAGVIEPAGKISNTGGRSAVTFGIAPGYRYAIGVFLSTNHITIVSTDLKGDVTGTERVRRKMDLQDPAYLKKLGELVGEMKVRTGQEPDRCLGVGITLPSLISDDGERILHGFIHDFTGISRSTFAQYIAGPVSLFHDSYAAGFSEIWRTPELKNAIYLNLNNTIGSCVISGGSVYSGDNGRSGEFGHLIMHPRGGRKCYCGRSGCLNTVCNTGILDSYTNGSLPDFFRLVDEGDKGAAKLWDSYLEELAPAIHNLRMMHDCSIIIGGYIGAYAGRHICDICRKVDEYSVFTENSSEYIYPCRYQIEATAAGAAILLIDRYFRGL